MAGLDAFFGRGGGFDKAHLFAQINCTRTVQIRDMYVKVKTKKPKNKRITESAVDPTHTVVKRS